MAIELAAALSRQGTDTLLVDADTVGPAVGQQLGLVDDTSGVAAAVRIASAGPLRANELAALAVAVPSGPRVLVGLPNAARWTELRPASWEAVLACARQTVPITVVDVGYGLEGDDTRWADPATPQRFGAALSTLATADVLVCVGRSDPVGVVRLVRELPRARDCAPTAVPLVVMNHAGATAARRGVDDVVTEMLDLPVTLHVPDDSGATRSALAHGCAVVEVEPRSPVVAGVRGAGVPRGRAGGFVRSSTCSGYRGLIVDFYGVLTDGIDVAMRAWSELDDIDYGHFQDAMAEWFGDLGGFEARFNPVHALERGELEVPDFEQHLARRLTRRDGRPVRPQRPGRPHVQPLRACT